jgi:G3E family GTPase
VITGFLGSGKTTLLQRLLNLPNLADTAVLINELGEISIDHALVQHVRESIVVLSNGCLCCAVRDDLGRALRDLLARRERSEIGFSRLVIETTGLADPGPILHTLMTDPVIDSAFELSAVVTTVDAVSGATNLDREAESLKQVAIADHIVLSKTDIADAIGTERLAARLLGINPGAKIATAAGPDFDPAQLLLGGGWDIARIAYDATAGMGFLTTPKTVPRHDDAITSHSIIINEPLEWTGFAVWLTMLLHRHGADVLRLKALLNVEGARRGPLVLHGVQHLVHPPSHLERWPDSDTRSRLVFITRGISGATIAHSLRTFCGAARRLRNAPDPASAILSSGLNGTEIGGRPVRRADGLSWMKQSERLASGKSADLI